jgi:hypothetical protein
MQPRHIILLIGFHIPQGPLALGQHPICFHEAELS